jgi:hypothetical protein
MEVNGKKLLLSEKKTEQYSEYQKWLSLLPKMPGHCNHIP